MEFHISRKARERYQFAESLFSCTGNVVFANMAACRVFAHRMNQVRDVEKHPEQVVHAGKLFAMGLIDEASHLLMARYREQFDPAVMTGALDFFSAQVSAEALDKMLLTFVEQFPGISVIRGIETPRQWLAGESDGMPHRAAALEELLLLWTANRNQAFQAFRGAFRGKDSGRKDRLSPGHRAVSRLLRHASADSVTGRQANESAGVAARSGGGRAGLAGRSAGSSFASSGSRCWAIVWSSCWRLPWRFCTRRSWPSGCSSILPTHRDAGAVHRRQR